MLTNPSFGHFFNLFKKYLFSLTIIIALFAQSVESVYILRYSTIDNGGILFAGNTLGLSKEVNQNQPGTSDANGAFITIDQSQQVGYYMPGTTLNWRQNSSTGFLDMPEGSTVLYAELIWSGSYGFEQQITGNEPNTPIILITPQNNVFTITPDPATSQVALTPGFSNAGNYTRSANVTSIVQSGGSGLYIAGGIPATISKNDNTHNAAGWTLAVVFRNGAMGTSNLTVFVGCEQASSESSAPAQVSGFCTPTSGTLSGNLFISAIEGDANKMGDRMLFGSSVPLTIAANSLSGVNNPINNFFGSQINTLLPFNGTEFVGSGQLDTRGSFGNFNANPFTGVILPGSRQGYDITNVDISNKLTYDQTVAYAKGTTTGDDYTINALAMQIRVGSPFLQLTKQTTETMGQVGDTVTFSFNLANTSTIDAESVVFHDLLEPGLSFVPNTLFFNSVLQPGADPSSFSIGTLPNTSVTISFDVHIDSYPASGSIFNNQANVGYSFDLCSGQTLDVATVSNIVQIELPKQEVPLLVVNKLVNSSEAIGSSLGDTVIFTVDITNTGTGDALNATFIDPLPAGLELVPGSVLVDNEIVSPDPDLSAGFSVGNILHGQIVTVQFQAVITAPPPGPLYFNSATIKYQYLEFHNVIVDLDPAASNTVTISLRVPPVGFQGILRECNYLNGTKFILDTDWINAFSTDVIAYRIYSEDGKLLATVPATQNSLRLFFSSRRVAKNIEIASLYSGNIESSRLKIRIL